MRHLKLKIAYDGTDFHGWQVQPGLPTIQGLLQSVLADIEGRPVPVHGAGRTDAGVHALAQVASVELSNPIPAENLRKAMNRWLPDAVRVLDVEEVTADFHPRHCAKAKTYEYRIWRGEVCPPVLSRYVYPHTYPLDEPAMIEAAARFAGTHDFRSLAAANAPGKESTVRTIFSSTLERKEELLVYRVRGSGFLHHMVRNIVGVLLDVGRGAISPADVDTIIAARQRSAAGPTAPGRGLFLVEVEYGTGEEQP
jgi:tRNA pseudouridine38-40 synthase